MKKYIRKLLDWCAEHGIEIAITIMILAILTAILLPQIVMHYAGASG